MATTRVTVTLPEEVVHEIDRQDANRSRFVMEAVARELARRRREFLRVSLREPHPDSQEVAQLGLTEWVGSEDAFDLLDPAAGTEVRWEPESGWRQVP